MMSGLTEILLIVAIFLAVFLLPRMMSKPSESNAQRRDRGIRFTGWQRLAIFASFLWPALLALHLKPWKGHWFYFLSVAIGPVALAWGVFWVVSGFKNKRN
jgi:hypothetical protein